LSKPLASFTVTSTGPNVFQFAYKPSEVEPFEIRAYLTGSQEQAIGIPLGMGGAILRHVPPQD